MLRFDLAFLLQFDLGCKKRLSYLNHSQRSILAKILSIIHCLEPNDISTKACLGRKEMIK